MPKKLIEDKMEKIVSPHRMYFTFGLGKERDYFVENLSMLISGGMPIIAALDSIAAEMRSRRMKNIIANITCVFSFIDFLYFFDTLSFKTINSFSLSHSSI